MKIQREDHQIIRTLLQVLLCQNIFNQVTWLLSTYALTKIFNFQNWPYVAAFVSNTQHRCTQSKKKKRSGAALRHCCLQGTCLQERKHRDYLISVILLPYCPVFCHCLHMIGLLKFLSMLPFIVTEKNKKVAVYVSVRSDLKLGMKEDVFEGEYDSSAPL